MTRINYLKINRCLKKSINQMHSEQEGKCDYLESGVSEEVASELAAEEVKP